jgi:hypothetical protein
MIIGRDEALEIVKEGRFRISDPGPLHVPVQDFSISRDNNLSLILKTDLPANATSNSVRHPLGTLRINEDRVALASDSGADAMLIGVQPLTVQTTRDSQRSGLQETASIHHLTVTISNAENVAYVIEWLENLPQSPFIWPDTVRTESEKGVAREISLTDKGITILDPNGREDLSQSAAKVTIGSQTFYVLALRPEDMGTGIRPGCILYVGAPDELARKKIRTALSLALGVYLVELGHTSYDRDWRITCATSRKAYSLDEKAFGLAIAPLAPLSNRDFRYDIERPLLTRMVTALASSYESLDLANLSWAYWHARAATVHIAPAHFGAAIEALQRAYIRGLPAAIPRSYLKSEEWRDLQTSLSQVIDQANISEQSKLGLKENLGRLNQVPQRTELRAIMETIDLDLGEDEDEAWKRRNRAAHGLPIEEGKELSAIRDTHLLEGLFHRMLLRISGASDRYVDYASLHIPYRYLKEPPASIECL